MLPMRAGRVPGKEGEMADLAMFNVATPAGGKVAPADAKVPDDFPEKVQRLLSIREELKTLEAENKQLSAEVSGPLSEVVYGNSARARKVTLSATAAGIMLTLQRRGTLTPEQAASLASVLPAGGTEDASKWEVNVGALATLPAEVLAMLAKAGVLARKPALALTETGWTAFFCDPAVREACQAAGVAPVATLKADPKSAPTVLVDGKRRAVLMEGEGGAA